MPKKTVREMNIFQRFNHSLGAKIFRALILFALILGAAALTFGFYLYTSAVRKEYRSEAWQLSKSTAVILNQDEVRIVSKRILEVYDSLSEVSSQEKWDDSLTDAYTDVADYLFAHVQLTLKNFAADSDAKDIYIGALDRERSRLIYIVDYEDDGLHDYCPPGKWDILPEDELNIYLEGSAISSFDKLFGTNKSMPAAINTTEEYGYLCTAATHLMDIGDYSIMAFCDMDMNYVSQISRNFLIQYILILLVVAVILGFITARHLKKIVVNPVNKLADAALAYTSDKRQEGQGSGHFANLDIHTGDEIESLSLTMKDMEKDMGAYIADLTSVTAEKERINTELDVAGKIQEGMIPHIFPAFPDRSEFDIYATMTTAKEVGGDFYDYFLIDHDHLAMVMADVSGKGVPAALFMMASKIIIQNITTISGSSPAQILEYVNSQICSNNEAEMFVTVWLGIVDLTTGVLKAANAGHEYPAIKRAGGQFELFKDKHGFVIGGMDGVKYKEYEIQLETGDELFQYTDGVTEATNADEELFGTERMIEALNTDGETDPEKILKNVKASIDGFVNGADQFDDITMMCFKYIGYQK